MIVETDPLEKRITKIEKLRVRTIDRNATQAEADTAAMLIGRELMRHPDLEVRPRGSHAGGDCVNVTGACLLRRTPKAALVNVPDIGERWFPLSQIIAADWSAGTFTVKRWVWERNQ